MRNIVLITILVVLSSCGTRFDSNTSTLIRKRVEANEATINLARKSSGVTSAKLYEDAIIRSSAELTRIADIIDDKGSNK